MENVKNNDNIFIEYPRTNNNDNSENKHYLSAYRSTSRSLSIMKDPNFILYITLPRNRS